MRIPDLARLVKEPAVLFFFMVKAVQACVIRIDKVVPVAV
jgi:hypothetical protein